MNKLDFNKAKINYHMSPGEMLKTIRLLQGWTQMELSRLTHVSQSNISAYESDRKQIGREMAITFAKALHVHPAVLMFPDFDINKVA